MASEHVGIFEAKTQFSGLIEKVEAGATIIVTKKGKPVAKIVPLSKPARRNFGRGDARIVIAPDFDELPDDVMRAFNGE